LVKGYANAKPDTEFTHKRKTFLFVSRLSKMTVISGSLLFRDPGSKKETQEETQEKAEGNSV